MSPAVSSQRVRPPASMADTQQYPYLTPDHYAKLSTSNNNPYLRLYKVKRDSFPVPWYFVHPLQPTAVHMLSIVEDKEGRRFVNLLLAKRPTMGGRLTVECPAGRFGEQSLVNTPLEAGIREVQEETGCHPLRAELLAPDRFSTSGGITSEHKIFGICYSKEPPETHTVENEKQHVIMGNFNVPLETFQDYDKFQHWLQQMDNQGFTLGQDVIAARGLLPPDIGKYLNIVG